MPENDGFVHCQPRNVRQRRWQRPPAAGVPSEDGEQGIKVLVVPREPVVLAALGDWLAERWSQFMTPRYLETVRSRAVGPTRWDRSA